MPLIDVLQAGLRIQAVRITVAAAALTINVHLTHGIVLAQEPADDPPRAGIVVQLSEGDVREKCVELPADEVTGFELLQAAGLELRTEESSMGVMVCRIEDAGCPDAEPCMCECQDAGGDCKYWAYNVLADGEWTYSDVGATDRVVRHGDVDGWAWGSGTETGGPMPPVRTFADVCGDREAGGSADENVTSPGAESDASGGWQLNKTGYFVIGLVVVVIGGVWIWSRRS